MSLCCPFTHPFATLYSISAHLWLVRRHFVHSGVHATAPWQLVGIKQALFPPVHSQPAPQHHSGRASCFTVSPQSSQDDCSVGIKRPWSHMSSPSEHPGRNPACPGARVWKHRAQPSLMQPIYWTGWRVLSGRHLFICSYLSSNLFGHTFLHLPLVQINVTWIHFLEKSIEVHSYLEHLEVIKRRSHCMKLFLCHWPLKFKYCNLLLFHCD